MLGTMGALLLSALRARPATAAALLALLLVARAAPVSAADTDLVVIRDGDRIHGELKGLRFARLEVSTSATGTLGDGDSGSLQVTLEGQRTALALERVVRIRFLKASFRDRLDGAITLGASYTTSSEIGQGSLSIDVGWTS